MKIGKVRAAFLMALVLAGAAGCASGGGSTSTTSGPAPTATASMPMESSPAVTSAAPGTGSAMASAAAITIKDFAYGDPITVSPGGTVTVTNMDTAEHTVTADQGSAFDVEVKENGGTATFTAPSQPGTYAYHCTYHPNMHGTLTVQ